MTKRTAISKKIRFEVMKRDSFKCQYCGRSAPEIILVIDHIHPVADGGDNNITNLITSCFDCNAGKSDRKLSDSSTMEKRKKQLDELQERREQIELMAAWQIELMELEDQAVYEIDQLWRIVTKRQFYLNDHGKKLVKGWIKKFGLSEVMESLRISTDQYLEESDGKITKVSADKAILYIEKICAVRKQQQEKPQLKEIYYIRGILANRFDNYLKTDWSVIRLLERAYWVGISLEHLKDLAVRSKSWSEFESQIELEIVVNA
jgi:hypothetical protein